MRLHSVFLRDDCILPDSLDPLRHPSGEHWTWVQDIPSSVFDTMIRQAGWNYIWMMGCCSRRGFAREQEAAIEKGLARALGAVKCQANAAEFDSVLVARFLGFHLANVTVQRRRIQESSTLAAN